MASLGLPRGRVWADIRRLRATGHDIVKVGASGSRDRPLRFVLKRGDES